MQAPKVPFVTLAGPFTPSGNTILVTGGTGGEDQLVVARLYAVLHFVYNFFQSGIGLALAAKLLELGNIVSSLSSFFAVRNQTYYGRSLFVGAVRMHLPRPR